MEFDISRRMLIAIIWVMCSISSMITKDTDGNHLIGAFMFTVAYGLWVGMRS